MPPGEHHHPLAELDFSIRVNICFESNRIIGERGGEVFKPARRTIDLEEF